MEQTVHISEVIFSRSNMGIALVLATITIWKLLVNNYHCRNDAARLQSIIEEHASQLGIAQELVSEWQTYAGDVEQEAIKESIDAKDEIQQLFKEKGQLKSRIDELIKGNKYLSAEIDQMHESVGMADAARDKAIADLDVARHELRDAMATLSSKGVESKQTKMPRNYRREIAQYRKSHPDASMAQAARELSIGSHNTVKRYWDMPSDNESNQEIQA